MSPTSRLSHYRFLDRDVTIESDLESFWNIFDRDYSLFEISEKDCACELRLSVRSQGSEPTFSNGIRSISLAGHPKPGLYSYQLLMRAIMERMDHYLILHGAVVSRGGRALVISGRPGSGKSTLTMALLDQGFTYLSDDFCPIHRETGLVHPFPRSPWIRRDDVDSTPTSDTDGVRRGKTSIDLRSADTGVGNTPCPVSGILCLDPGGEQSPDCELTIEMKPGGGEAVLEDLRRINGISKATLDRSHSALRVYYPRDAEIASALFRLLRKHEERFWQVFRESIPTPDFDGEPSLEPLTLGEASMFLLRDIKQSLASDLESGGAGTTPGELFLALSRLISGVPCHRLHVGRLERMTPLACRFHERRPGDEW